MTQEMLETIVGAVVFIVAIVILTIVCLYMYKLESKDKKRNIDAQTKYYEAKTKYYEKVMNDIKEIE